VTNARISSGSYEIGMHDDAIAHDGDAAVRIPEDARLLVAADLHARHIALGKAGNGGNLTSDQRRRTAGRIDVGDANLAPVEAAALHKSGPLLELGRTRGDGNAFSLEIFRGLDV